MLKTKLTILAITLILLSSCTFNRVADYDQDTARKIIEISKRIDLFYIELAEGDAADRQFKKFNYLYNEIEVELRALILINKMRPKNEESTKICEHILLNWLEFKAAHQKNDAYKNSLLDVDWSTMREQFYALAIAEASKL